VLDKRVLDDFGARKLGDVTRFDLQDLVDRVLAEGLSPSTIQNTLMPLRAIYRRALQRGEVAVNPTTMLEVPSGGTRRDRVASPEEAEQLLAALPLGDRALWATGARRWIAARRAVRARVGGRGLRGRRRPSAALMRREGQGHVGAEDTGGAAHGAAGLDASGAPARAPALHGPAFRPRVRRGWREAARPGRGFAAGAPVLGEGEAGAGYADRAARVQAHLR
jgi:hypothetical protein